MERDKMSLRYKVLGRPQTFDEFVDKVQKIQDTKVDVVLGQYNGGGILGHKFNYNCVVSVKAGKILLTLKTHTFVRSGNLIRTTIGKNRTEQAGLKDAVEIAEKLNSHGLEATISGRKIEEAREGIAQYDKVIAEISQKYSAHL